MLTALSLKGPKQDKPTVLQATQLLAMLQQALPGVTKPDGVGMLDNPWIPKTPAEWWYCSKEKPKRIAPTVSSSQYTYNETKRFWNDKTNLAWLKVGGSYVSIKPDNFYASQHQTPARDSTAVPAVKYEDMAYSDIYSQMAKDSGTGVKDIQTATQIRAMLKGGSGGSSVLPLLTSVLFVSEVARNHTAFHTNLMMLDLVEKGVSITGGTSFKYTMKSVLWAPQIIDGVMALQRLEQQKLLVDTQKAGLDKLFADKKGGRWLTKPEMNRLRNAGTENASISGAKQQIERDKVPAFASIRNGKVGYDELNSPTLARSGGEAVQPGGLASMSHKGSAYGSAYDLEGSGEYRGVKGGTAFTRPTSPLTIVRRKEATILIRWLERALHGKDGLQAVALADDRALETRGLYDGIQNSFGTLDEGAMKILQLMQQRVDSFDQML